MAASDPRGWMWKEALAVIEQAEHLHRRFFEPGFSALQAAVWEPPVDIFEADEESDDPDAEDPRVIGAVATCF